MVLVDLDIKYWANVREIKRQTNSPRKQLMTLRCYIHCMIIMIMLKRWVFNRPFCLGRIFGVIERCFTVRIRWILTEYSLRDSERALNYIEYWLPLNRAANEKSGIHFLICCAMIVAVSLIFYSIILKLQPWDGQTQFESCPFHTNKFRQ